jgi:protein-S-isoprenylcysteine O-methyltransferase Ste14
MTPSAYPLFIIGLAIAFYWLRVVQKALRAKRRSGRAANFIPQERTGRWNRWIWTPVIVVWVAHPFYAAIVRRPIGLLNPLHVPLAVKWVAAGVVVCGVVLTTYCWKRMGKSWRMGIDPNEKTSLVVTGAYAWVRHPIYALSGLMMLATMGALPSALMLACGVVHLAFLVWEARREERYLSALHGESYRRYCLRVGRFFPAIVHRPARQV